MYFRLYSIIKPALLSLALLLFLPACGHSRDSLKNYSYTLEELMDSLSIPVEGIRIAVDKSDYVLSVLFDTLVIKQYPVVFGGNPVDDKLRQGDGCTPEGRFRVLTKYPHRSWDRFIWIDYPNEESLVKHRKAKRDGIISESDAIGGEIRK